MLCKIIGLVEREPNAQNVEMLIEITFISSNLEASIAVSLYGKRAMRVGIALA